MRTTSSNLVLIYGDPDDREQVISIANIALGAAELQPFRVSNSFGRLLAITKFDWFGESPVAMVEELSRRRPDVMFDLRPAPLPGQRGTERLVLVGGQVASESGPITLPVDDTSILVSHPRVTLRVVLRDDGSVDFVATVKATMDGLHSIIDCRDESCEPWEYQDEINLRCAGIAALESLLTPEELQQVTRHREEYIRESSRRAARENASACLQEVLGRMAHPDVDCLLDEEDRRAIARLAAFATNL